MSKLAASFPTLKDAPGVAPLEARTLDHWASSSPAVTSGSLAATRFVLSVFNPSTQFECGQFDLHEALSVWDADHRAVFPAWATAPLVAVGSDARSAVPSSAPGPRAPQGAGRRVTP